MKFMPPLFRFESQQRQKSLAERGNGNLAGLFCAVDELIAPLPEITSDFKT
jgi:hypothetical protein